MRKLAAGAFLIAAMSPALADPPGLKLTYGQVVTDPTGAFVSVQVANTGTITLSQIVVTCNFFAKKKNVGSSYTTLFSSFPGITGQDQVRLMGATSATTATCAITTPAS
ncbi:hypothetical protein ABLE91_06180 [Aquabacter sp. CN5-332]|uniref:hypothetical protein n=1 Tax=Aquabacter sp. CN5-332 TaxID=3156608 RepID=UPI0032B3DD1E